MKRAASWILPIIKDKWFLLYLGISFLYCTLFIFNTYPPFQDYPNHLLEAKVIANPEKFAPYYELDLKPVPNITNQISLALLSMIMDVNLAGRIYNMLYIILFGIGAYLFSRIFLNKNFLAGLVFFLFCCNFFFWRGYMNYIMGVALCLSLLSVSHAWALKKGASSILFDVICVLILYFTHALVAGVFILFKLIHVVLNEKKRVRYLLLFLLPVSILAIMYIVSSSSQDFSWNYGIGLWKIVSLKRLVALPYVSTLDTMSIFALLNIYNLCMYLGFIVTLILFIMHLKRINALNSSNGVLKYLLLVLACIYLVLPNSVGDILVDNRFSFFIILFTTACVFDHILKRYRFLIKGYGVVITLLLGLNLYLAFAQFHVSQQYFHELISSFSSLALSKEEELYVPRKKGIDALSKRSALFHFLEKIKLHTDVTQVTYSDEHADSFFYFNGGYPRKLFTSSIIKKRMGNPILDEQ